MSLLSTENTILENWPGPKTTDPPETTCYHFALKQSGVSIDFHLEQFYRGEKVVIHRFDTLSSLLTICRRYQIDMIMIGSRSDMIRDIELVRSIKENVFLSIIPVILYHPEPPRDVMVAAYQSGAEDFIHGQWVEKLVEVRIRKAIERSKRDQAINPSTQLPGPTIIEREVNRQLKAGSEFAVCYADLDNFKAYNDYYGYVFGDRVIRLTARIIKDAVFDLCPGGFVGHIAGDDYIFIIPISQVDQICEAVLKTFDSIIPYRYKEEDRERGHITTVGRRGEVERFPLLTLSIAVLLNINGTFSHMGEMSKMLADLKKATKAREGSNYLVERRQKY
ncbi:MAG: diguanylate cyclase [candidate division Zixibacteria bacterium]|nr:diguanylate cyclase [candidate division Zixibacteria bacterium]